MTSKIVKCTNCNIVINEVLAFVYHVLDYMDEESIHHLCSSSFSEKDIVTAKNLLCDSLPGSKKMPKRRKEGKKKLSRDLADIICLMKSTDAELFPIFVAKELDKLPPVSFDHVDVTRLLKDIMRLQTKVSALEEKTVNKENFDALKMEVENMKHASIVELNGNLNVNRKRGACLQNSLFDSGPIGLHYVPIKTSVQESADCEINERPALMRHSSVKHNSEDSFNSFISVHNYETEKLRHVEARAITAVSDTNSTMRRNSSDSVSASETGQQVLRVEDSGDTAVLNKPVCQLNTCERASNESPTNVLRPAEIKVSASTTNTNELYTAASAAAAAAAAAAGRAGELVSSQTCKPVVSNSDSEWTLVRGKAYKQRYKLLGQKGCAFTAPDVNFRAADTEIPLYISNVNTNTSEEDIISYIKNKTQITVALKRINMKVNKSYNAFKIFVPKVKLDVFMNDSFWPDGITFRLFMRTVPGQKTSSSNVIIT